MGSLRMDQKWLDDLAQNSWCAIDHALDSTLSQDLRLLAEKYFSENRFKNAGIGGGTSQVESTIRSDSIYWLNDYSEAPELESLWKVIWELKSQLNQNFYLNITDFEGHFARYASGAHYDRHIDQSPLKTDSERVITFLLYLNPDWKASDGGNLIIHAGSKSQKVLPIANRVVLMDSKKVLHEVEKTTQPRWSFCGWFRRKT